MMDYIGGVKTEKQQKDNIKKDSYQRTKAQTIKNLKIVLEKLEKDEFVGTIFVNQWSEGKGKIVGFGTMLAEIFLALKTVQNIFTNYNGVLEYFLEDVLSATKEIVGKREEEFKDVGVG